MVDSSALLALLLEEPDYPAYCSAIAESDHVVMAAANYTETNIVAVCRLGKQAFERVDALLLSLNIEVCEMNRRQAQLAREAFAAYGKGRHEAGLNICDCFAYALAKEYDAPLLFKGNDFSLTDIESVL